MAGMAGLKTALVAVAGEIAKYTVKWGENLRGHYVAAGSHGVVHSLAAQSAAFAVSPDLDAPLAAFLAVLDARYAAGATPGPIASIATAQAMIGGAAGAAVAAAVEYYEKDAHGHARGPAKGILAGTEADTNAQSEAAAGLTTLFTDLDARYAAGTQSGAIDTTALAAACALIGHEGAFYGIRTLETARGHNGAQSHGAAHEAAAADDASAAVNFVIGALITPLIALWDARYQAHA